MQQLAVFVCAVLLVVTSQKRLNCLPSGVKLTDVVSAEMTGSSERGPVVKKVTVKQKLTDLKARCRNGKLVDDTGKEVRFYRAKGCWGNPPADYLEILDRQRRELEELKKQYTVIEMTCNPSGMPIP